MAAKSPAKKGLTNTAAFSRAKQLATGMRKK
jgi:hypothetical protein